MTSNIKKKKPKLLILDNIIEAINKLLNKKMKLDIKNEAELTKRYKRIIHYIESLKQVKTYT